MYAHSRNISRDVSIYLYNWSLETRKYTKSLQKDFHMCAVLYFPLERYKKASHLCVRSTCTRSTKGILTTRGINLKTFYQFRFLLCNASVHFSASIFITAKSLVILRNQYDVNFAEKGQYFIGRVFSSNVPKEERIIISHKLQVTLA